MGIRGELFTTQVSAENRTYFLMLKKIQRATFFYRLSKARFPRGLALTAMPLSYLKMK